MTQSFSECVQAYENGLDILDRIVAKLQPLEESYEVFIKRMTGRTVDEFHRDNRAAAAYRQSVNWYEVTR